MPQEDPARIARELADHGYAADREAITLLARAADPDEAVALAVQATPDDALKLSADDVRTVLGDGAGRRRAPLAGDGSDADHRSTGDGGPTPNDGPTAPADERVSEPVESTEGGAGTPSDGSGGPAAGATAATGPDETGVETVTVDTSSGANDPPVSGGEPSGVGADASDAPQEVGGSVDATDAGAGGPGSLEVGNDMTGRSTGTGAYEDFVATFRDRYARLSRMLQGRVTHRNATALSASPGGGDAGMIGMISDIRSTANGHWLIELEDTTGVFPCLVLKDRDVAGLVDELLYDEVVAVEGALSDDGGVLFVDELYFPDVPRTHEPSTADRPVRAALVSDVHVGSEEFAVDAWQRFASWLHTDEAETIEYLLIAGDMVEGVGVYPDQDEELEVVDIFEQYERFAEHLKDVPGDLEIVMIPGNHDAVRLAEPQPGFDEELREIMRVHDARVASNPAVVDVEGVSILMYHGVSLDEVIAELPASKASYDDPHLAMAQLLKKRHVAPQFGGHTRLAPEERDYLVMDDVPDVFHTGHVHKLGVGIYRDVLAINSGCWQTQTDFQKSVNIDPDVGFAPVVDLDTLDVTVHKFS